MNTIDTDVKMITKKYTVLLYHSSNEASSEPYDVSVVSYLWHTSSITHYEPKPADQVVGLVVIDEPRPTGRTPEKESSGSSSSERAVTSSPA